MSRSYKKNPYCTDNGNSKYGKRIANRVTRKKLKSKKFEDEVLPKGKKYKQLYCSYDICDYKFYETKKEAMQNGHLKLWFKYHLRK